MVTRRDILTRLRADTAAAAPDWASRPTDPVSGALDATATVVSESLLYAYMRERAAFVQYAEGADLIALARGRGVVVDMATETAVVAGETAATEALRTLAIDAIAELQPSGNLDAIEAQARTADSEVAQAVAQPDYDAGRITVYLLRADSGATAVGAALPGTPTAAMVAAVSAYITARSRQAAAFQYTVSPTTPITRYYFTAAITHDGTNANVEDEARSALYAHIDAQRRMGLGTLRAGLFTGVLFRVAGVTDVQINRLSVTGANTQGDLTVTGAADLIARTAFSCRKDTTDAALTFSVATSI